MADREIRATLEATQHEARALAAELLLPETPGFSAKREALETGVRPLEAAARELTARVIVSEAQVVAAKRKLLAVEDTLLRREQNSLSWVLAVVVFMLLSVATEFLKPIWQERIVLLCGVCGLWSGWLIAGHAIGRWASSGRDVAAPSVFNVAEGALGALMLGLSLFVGAIQPMAERASGLAALIRVGVAPGLLLLAGVAARRRRQDVLLASATGFVIAFSTVVGLDGRSLHLPHTAVADQRAALLNAALLPVLVVAMWRTAATRGAVGWRVMAALALVGATCANVWLTTVFTEVRSFRFVSIGGLAAQLVVAATFFALASPEGRARRVLLRLATLVGVWAAAIFGVLFFTRLID